MCLSSGVVLVKSPIKNIESIINAVYTYILIIPGVMRK